MKKYRVQIYTTSEDLSPICEMDEFMLNEFLDFGESIFVDIEDDTKEINCRISISQLVGIEWTEIL